MFTYIEQSWTLQNMGRHKKKASAARLRPMGPSVASRLCIASLRVLSSTFWYCGRTTLTKTPVLPNMIPDRLASVLLILRREWRRVRWCVLFIFACAMESHSVLINGPMAWHCLTQLRTPCLANVCKCAFPMENAAEPRNYQPIMATLVELPELDGPSPRHRQRGLCVAVCLGNRFFVIIYSAAMCCKMKSTLWEQWELRTNWLQYIYIYK